MVYELLLLFIVVLFTDDAVVMNELEGEAGTGVWVGVGGAGAAVGVEGAGVVTKLGGEEGVVGVVGVVGTW